MLPKDLIRDAKEKADAIEHMLSPFGYTFEVCGYWQRGFPSSLAWLDEWWREPRPWATPLALHKDDEWNMWYWDRGLARAIELQTGSKAAYECPLKPMEVAV